MSETLDSVKQQDEISFSSTQISSTEGEECSMEPISVDLDPYCQIQFVHSSKWTAQVSETVGMFHRVRTLPVVCQKGFDVQSVIQSIYQSNKCRTRNRIQVLRIPYQHVFVGTVGLQGGTPFHRRRRKTRINRISNPPTASKESDRQQSDFESVVQDNSILRETRITFPSPDVDIPQDTTQYLRDLLKSSDVSSVLELVQRVNACQHTSEMRMLLKWAMEHVKMFLNSSIETLSIDEIKEYLSFVRVKAEGEHRRQFLAKWFCSVANKLAEHRLGEAAVIEEVEKAMHLMDSSVFAGDPSLLIRLCNTLLDKLDVGRIILTKNSYPTYSPVLYTIHHLISLLRHIAPAEWNPNLRNGLYQRYKERIKTLKESTEHYPFRFLLKLLEEGLKHLQLIGPNVRAVDIRRRIAAGLQGSVYVASVVRNLMAFEIDGDQIAKGWSLWKKALKSNTNNAQKRWFLKYQQFSQACYSALLDSEEYSEISKLISGSLWDHFSLQKPAHEKAQAFGCIGLLEMLFLRSDSHQMCRDIIKDLLHLRDRWYKNSDIISKILDTLATACLHEQEPCRDEARNVLIEWSRTGRCFAVKPSSDRSWYKDSNKAVVLLAQFTRWLDGSSLQEHLIQIAPGGLQRQQMAHDFFEKVKEILWMTLPSVASKKEQEDKTTALHTLSPPPLVNFFKGREAELSDILELFKKQHGRVIAPPIVGHGGVGKTQLAVKLFTMQRTNCCYDHSFWIPSHSNESLIDSFLMIARVLEIHPDENSSQDTINMVRLRLNDTFCLYVFDNAPSFSDLEMFLPLSSGHVIVTSRESSPSKWFTDPKPLALNPLNSKDAFEIAVRFSFKGSKSESQELMAELSKVSLYPLTAAQIFSTLQLENYSARQWIQRIRNLSSVHEEDHVFAELSDVPHDRINYDQSITDVIRQSLQTLQDTGDEKGQSAQRLLVFLSYMDSNGIPLEWALLWNAEDETDDKRLTRKCLCLLENHSLIQWSRDAQLLYVHSEVQLVVRNLYRDVDLSVVVETLSDFVGDVNWEHVNYAKWMSTLSHARTLFSRMEMMKCPVDLLRQLAYHLVLACKVASLFGESVDWARKRVNLAKQCHPAQDHADVTDALQSLALSLQERGNQLGAYDLLREALDIERRTSRDEESGRMIDRLLALGHCAYALSKTEEALEMFEEALKLSEQLEATDKAFTRLQLKNNVANCLSDLERDPVALEIRRTILDEVLLFYGDEENPYVANCFSNLGSSLAKTGNRAEAILRFRRALEIRNRLYGSRPHPDKLQSLHNLSWLLSKMGFPEEAYEYSKQALDMAHQLHGREDHADVISALQQVTVCWPTNSQNNDYRLMQANHALYMAKRLYSRNGHPLLARSHGIVGVVYETQGEDGFAASHFHIAYSLMKELRGDESAAAKFYKRKWKRVRMKSGETVATEYESDSLAETIESPDACSVASYAVIGPKSVASTAKTRTSCRSRASSFAGWI